MPRDPQRPAALHRKRDRTAAHLSGIAFELFEKHGYETVTMEQIAQAAGVSKVTLYKYFPVKEALIAHRFGEEFRDGMAALEATLSREDGFKARMQKLLNASATWNAARRELMPHYLRFRFSEAGRGERFRSGIYEILETLFREAQRQGEIRTDVPAGELAWMFEMLCFGALVAWLKDERRSLKLRFQSALDVVLHGTALSPARTPSRRRPK